MTTKIYQKEFVVVTEIEVGSNRIVSQVWRSPEGLLDSNGDVPAVYKLEERDGREQEYRAWYRNGKLHRDDSCAVSVTDLGSGVTVQEIFAVNDLIHRDGDEDPAVINRSRLTGRTTKLSFNTHGVPDRACGPAVIRFEPETGAEKEVEYWRHGRPVDPPTEPSKLDLEEPFS